MNQRTRKRNTESTRTKTGKKIRSIRNTSIVIKIEVKIRIRKKRGIKVVIMIPVLNPQRNTTRRLATNFALVCFQMFKDHCSEE